MIGHKKLLLSFYCLFLVTAIGAKNYAILPNFFETTSAFLGIESDKVSKKKAKILGFDNPYGNYVTKVIQNTAAERAGLEPFDYIIGIDDENVSQYRGFTSLLRKYQSGDKAVVHIIRNGKEKKIKVTFGSRADIRFKSSDSNQRPYLGISPIGENEPNQLGVRVNITSYATADLMGLQNGDLIVGINDYPMVDWNDITTAINSLDIGEEIEVKYERNGELRSAKSNIISYAETQRMKKRQRGERAFLGINSESVSKDKAKKLGFENRYGSYVTNVIPSTAAEKAGIQAFDYIYGVDEYRVGEYQNLSTILRKYTAGEDGDLHFIRKGDTKVLNVTFGRRSDARYRKRDECEDPFLGIRQSHKIPTEKGIAVQVIRNSTAEALGMETGDIILTINDYPIIDWNDISTSINNMEVGNLIKVTYLRDGGENTASEPIKSNCDTKKWGITEEKNYFNFDKESWGNFWETKSGESSKGGSIDLSKVRINVEDISPSEAVTLRTRNGNSSGTNDVQVLELELSPNPSKGLIILEFNLPQRETTIIRIFNDSGRVIYEYDLGRFSGDFKDDVDISQNGLGSYYLQVKQGQKTTIKKIVLQNS